MKSRVILMKLGRGYSCDERSGHGGNGNSAPASRQVAFCPSTVLFVTRGLLLTNLVVQKVISSSGENVRDWLLFSLREFASWTGCDAQSQCAENEFFKILFCVLPS